MSVKAQDEKKIRRCLKCDKDFKSQGFHNRICDTCIQTDVFSGIREEITSCKSRRKGGAE